MSNGMTEYFVHPKHFVILRGVQRNGGEKVQATLGEAAALRGKLLTAEEFEATCIDLQAASEAQQAEDEEKFRANVEALRKGEDVPYPTIEEEKE